MEKALRILDSTIQTLESEIRIWTKQGDLKIVEKCKVEIQQCKVAIQVLNSISGCLSQDTLIDMLDDKRVVDSVITKNAWYLVRKQAAEYLLDMCNITRK